MNAEDAAAVEVSDKDQVIAHLTKTLALTRECLEKARIALESIASEDDAARCHEIARDALREI